MPHESLLVEGFLEQAQQLAAEDPREHAHGQEEVTTGGEPAGVFGVEPAPGDDAVDVRMIEQQLGPGMQHGGEADLRPQAPAGHGLEGLGRGREQQLVRHRRGGEEEGVQFGGHGEDEVEVLDGEQITLLGLDPPGFVQSLALGAMPIAAGVVGELLMAAGLTLTAVAAERGRAALGDGLQHAPLLQGEAVEFVGMGAHDIGQFPAAGAGRRGAHGGRELARRGGQPGQIRQTVQRARGGLQLGVSDLRVDLGGAQTAVAEERLNHA